MPNTDKVEWWCLIAIAAAVCAAVAHLQTAVETDVPGRGVAYMIMSATYLAFACWHASLMQDRRAVRRNKQTGKGVK